jgi:hypothetical protein
MSGIPNRAYSILHDPEEHNVLLLERAPAEQE